MKKQFKVYNDIKPKVTVAELIAKLQTLPQDQEIVIYPKYDTVNGHDKHRFYIESVQRMEHTSFDGKEIDGKYFYCAIIF